MHRCFKTITAGLVLGVLSGLLALPANAADSIVRKSGGKHAGKITGATKTELTIKPPTGDAVNVPANEIAEVDWDDASAEFKLALGDENKGRLDSAATRLAKSKADTKTDSDLLKSDFDFLAARILARQSLADPAKRDEAIKQLQAFQKANPEHFRFYEALQFLGMVQLAKGDFDEARKSFEALAKAPWSDVKLTARIATGRILMGENKLDEAVRTFEEAASSAGNSAAEQARKYEAQLGRARALIVQSKAAEALPVLEEVTMKASGDDAPVQAEAYVLQGNALQALNRPKEAVLAYLHVDVLYPKETGLHAEALFHLSKLWKAVQLPERGLEAEAKLQNSYPNSDWTKKLAASPAG